MSIIRVNIFSNSAENIKNSLFLIHQERISELYFRLFVIFVIITNNDCIKFIVDNSNLLSFQIEICQKMKNIRIIH